MVDVMKCVTFPSRRAGVVVRYGAVLGMLSVVKPAAGYVEVPAPVGVFSKGSKFNY